ncbi:homeobox leucine zipper protein [Rhynchospora pubera]|uniref:Homeobox leucine zipper protein n=1 Tax=Rhynchospora pubera TaxID=906938 RepID=A0AAV8CVY2_9POAL|nr:homeobox leucine zipper protein [Rhynchospora pubera]
MELGLSLGDSQGRLADAGRELVLGLGVGSGKREEQIRGREIEAEGRNSGGDAAPRSGDPPVHLSLLPTSSLLNFSWPSDNQNRNLEVSVRGFDVNRAPSAEEMEEDAALSSSPNSAVSSFQMDFSARRGAAATTSGGTSAGNAEAERKGADGSHSRASDEDESGSARKKLRLSKEQSAFLEESFKEHNTLNPKQKLALAKQLNLRPRQVEVWFQNRRARTKLKQTEVDCEYLKRCCETLTEENRRLQKELAELRALKTAHPFYMHLPATTLSMCPSCERVASTATSSSSVVGAVSNTGSTSAAPTSASDHRPNSFAALFNRPRSGYPFAVPPQQPPSS